MDQTVGTCNRNVVSMSNIRSAGSRRGCPTLIGYLLVGVLALLAGACGDDDAVPPPLPAYPRDGTLRLNHIQVVGSHNSYHIQPKEPLFSFLKHLFGDIVQAWAYTHPPLDEQFESQGVRQIEIDVFADPNGGLF